MKKRSGSKLASDLMRKGGVSGSGSQTTHDPSASSGTRGKYRGGSTGTKKGTRRVNSV